jgi:hypothetical protein
LFISISLLQSRLYVLSCLKIIPLIFLVQL